MRRHNITCAAPHILNKWILYPPCRGERPPQATSVIIADVAVLSLCAFVTVLVCVCVEDAPNVTDKRPDKGGQQGLHIIFPARIEAL